MAAVSHSCSPKVSDVEARGTGSPRKPELYSEALSKTTKQGSERFSVSEMVAEWELVLQFDPQNQIKFLMWVRHWMPGIPAQRTGPWETLF